MWREYSVILDFFTTPGSIPYGRFVLNTICFKAWSPFSLSLGETNGGAEMICSTAVLCCSAVSQMSYSGSSARLEAA